MSFELGENNLTGQIPSLVSKGKSSPIKSNFDCVNFHNPFPHWVQRRNPKLFLQETFFGEKEDNELRVLSLRK